MERLDLMFVKRVNKTANKTLGNDVSEELHLLWNLLLQKHDIFCRNKIHNHLFKSKGF